MTTIIGSGNMARGIGTVLVKGGDDVTLLDRDPGKADEAAAQLRTRRQGATIQSAALDRPIEDDVVVLALPYTAESEIVRRLAPQLAGKIVVDISNPLNDTGDDLATPPGASAAEEVARLAPGARVVKAFNTTFAGTLNVGEVAGQPLDVVLAGDDAGAKARVAQLVKAGGLRPLDVGPLKRARQLEGLGLLHITQQSSLNTGFGSAVKILS